MRRSCGMSRCADTCMFTMSNSDSASARADSLKCHHGVTLLAAIKGKQVQVKLNSGVDYRGVLACLDGYMNIAMEQTEEYVNGQLKNKYGDAFIRGNNAAAAPATTTGAAATAAAAGGATVLLVQCSTSRPSPTNEDRASHDVTPNASSPALAQSASEVQLACRKGQPTVMLPPVSLVLEEERQWAAAGSAQRPNPQQPPRHAP
ncbi:hypothetical protein QJQ45_013218 [Haematococcus lacustris]|nr:hypothetical protein QJQ45_013218 [Haematococcus lacustris]